ncbi:hypothetical protein BGW38_007014, partial [Lunasporangiospora selenospora]
MTMSAASQQRICIGPTATGEEDPLSILLPHPSSGFPSRFIIQDGQLFEMQMVDSEGIRSWFVANTIQSDGSLYLTTPTDPIFMFIPILDIMRQKTSESEGRFLSVRDIFESDQYTSMRHLGQLNKVEDHLARVCEVQDSFEKTFRLKNELVMTWLKKKVQTLVDRFESIPTLVNSIAYTESLPEA